MTQNLHDLAETECPTCGYVIEFTSHITDQHPGPNKPGDIIICAGCGNVNRLNPTGLAKLTRREIRRLDQASQAQIKIAVATVLAKKISENQSQAGFN